MKWKTYPNYKDSGAEWLGIIPENWAKIRLGYQAKMIVPMRDKPPKFDGIIPWIRIEDFIGKYISESKSNQNVSEDTIREMNLKVFPVGTVLCSCSCQMGATAIVEKPLVSNQTFIGIVPGRNLDSNFLYYAIQHFSQYLQFLATGAIQQYLSREDFQQLRIFVPVKHDQIHIAAFLDRETDHIDTLIAKKQRQIELLQEKRSALISLVVTKGLNPNIKMKDSGVEWLGDIPEDWKPIRLKYLTRKIGSGKTPHGGSQIYSDSGIIFLRSQNIYDDGIRLEDVVYIDSEIDNEMNNTRVMPNDLLLNITGASIGRTCIVPSNFSQSNVNQHVCIIRLQNKIEPRFIAYYLKSNKISD